jgi:DNA polymerase III subunit delta'
MAKRAKSAKAPNEPDKPLAPGERPRVALRSLGDILGQPRAVATLRAAIASGRIHHAWVFYGSDGVGKFTTALAFASVILDPTSAPDLSGVIEPDPRSRVRHLIAEGTHPDLHVVTKELARYSDEKKIRDAKLITIPKDVIENHLLGPAALASNLPGGMVQKVFIVDEAELLDRHGGPYWVQNQLLKMLEEPPPGTVIILVTSYPERLLPTIRSRAQRVAFAPLDEPAMARWAKSAAAAVPELASLDDAARRWVLRFAAGSPGGAVMAARTGLYAWHTATADMLADLASGRRGAFPLGLGQAMWDLVDGWAAARVEAQPNASKDAANRAAARLMFRMVAESFREKLASANHDEQARALRAIDLLARAEQEADSNVQLSFVFENWAAQVAEA